MADQRKVGVTFLNPQTKLIQEQEVLIPTGLTALMVATRDACQALCRAHGFRWFACPSFVERAGAERWFVFRYHPASDMASLQRDWPTRAAAEMWMQHNAA